MTNEELHRAHEHSSKHRPEIEASKVCACYYCLSRFAPTEIREWITEHHVERNEEGRRVVGHVTGQTALCPKCGIDSVIGDACGYALTFQFVKDMQDHWFDKGVEWDQLESCPLCAETARAVGITYK